MNESAKRVVTLDDTIGKAILPSSSKKDSGSGQTRESSSSGLFPTLKNPHENLSNETSKQSVGFSTTTEEDEAYSGEEAAISPTELKSSMNAENETLLEILKQQQSIIQELRNQNTHLIEKQKKDIKEEVMTNLRAETQQLLMHMQMMGVGGQEGGDSPMPQRKRGKKKKKRSKTPASPANFIEGGSVPPSPINHHYSNPMLLSSGVQYGSSESLFSNPSFEVQPVHASLYSQESDEGMPPGTTIRQRMEGASEVLMSPSMYGGAQSVPTSAMGTQRHVPQQRGVKTSQAQTRNPKGQEAGSGWPAVNPLSREVYSANPAEDLHRKKKKKKRTKKNISTTPQQQTSGEPPEESPRPRRSMEDEIQRKGVSFSIMEESDEDMESSEDEEPLIEGSMGGDILRHRSSVEGDDEAEEEDMADQRADEDEEEEEDLDAYLDPNTMNLLNASKRLLVQSRVSTRQTSRRKRRSHKTAPPKRQADSDSARKASVEVKTKSERSSSGVLPSLAESRRTSEAEPTKEVLAKEAPDTIQIRRSGTVSGGNLPNVSQSIPSKSLSYRPSQGATGIPAHPLGETEWENEIAKNILTLYQTKMAHQFEAKQAELEAERQERQKSDAGVLFERLSISKQSMGRKGAMGGRKTANSRSQSSRPGTHSPIRSGASTRQGSQTHSPSRAHSRDRSHSPIRSAWGSRASLKTPQQTRSRVSTPAQQQQGGGGAIVKPKRRPPKNTMVIKAVDGQEAVVVVPKKPHPIWFSGTGTVVAEWGALVSEDEGGQALLKDLEGMEEAGDFMKYLALVEGLLTMQLRADTTLASNSLIKRLWQQLVVTANAFGVKCTEQKKYAEALELFRRAETLIDFKDVLDRPVMAELKAYVSDSYAGYYYKRKKPNAALTAIQRAMKIHVRYQQWPHVAKCHLHSGCILSYLTRHDEAIRCLGQVLLMVEDGRLDVGGTSPQKLCLVAVCYHNIAVEQLALRHISEACLSSQNSRRLARLCLSYSNRWLKNFENTHKIALAELAAMNVKNKKQSKEQQELFQKLAMEFYA